MVPIESIAVNFVTKLLPLLIINYIGAYASFHTQQQLVVS